MKYPNKVGEPCVKCETPLMNGGWNSYKNCDGGLICPKCSSTYQKSEKDETYLKTFEGYENQQ